MLNRKILHFLMNRSLFTKVFVSMCSVSLLAIFSLASLYEFYFKNILLEGENDRVQRSINQAALNLDLQIKKIINDMSYFFIYSDSGLDMLKADISDKVETDDMRDARKALDSFRMRYSGDLESVFFFLKDWENGGKEYFLHDLDFERIKEIDYTTHQWYRDLIAKKDVLWTAPSHEHMFYQDRSQRTIYLTMAKYDVDGKDGVFVTRLNEKMFRDAFRLLATPDLYIELHNQAGDIIYATLPPPEFNPDSGNWTLMVSTLEYSGFQVRAHVNTQTLIEEVEKVASIRTLIIAIVLVITFFISLLISVSLVRPVKKLLRLMRKVEMGDLDVRFPTKYTDEIGTLGMGFSKMMSRLSELVQQVYVERMEKMESTLRQKEATILAMQNQINPHFLYNTLETINCHAIVHNVPSITQMSKALADFFRYSIDNDDIEVKLGEEIKHIHTFLKIQQERHMQTEIDISIPDHLMHYPIIKLSLQPIVENAYNHAFVGERDYFLKIYGEDIDESSYAIYVEDNGEGIEDETLQQLNEKIYANSFELLPEKGNQYMRGIGLVNVHSRTRLRYGEAYGLRVDHSVTGGVVVRLLLPKRS